MNEIAMWSWDRDPDCFMTSGETTHLQEVRAVYGIRRVGTLERPDCLLAWVTPGISVALNDDEVLKDVQLVVLATIAKGTTLFPVTLWPMSVYVNQLLRPVDVDGSITPRELGPIGLAQLYRTISDAAIAAAQSRSAQQASEEWRWK